MTAIDRDIKAIEEQIHDIDIDMTAHLEEIRTLERRRATLVSSHMSLLLRREKTSTSAHKFKLMA